MEIVNEGGRLPEPALRPRVYEVFASSPSDGGRRVQRVDFHDQLKCVVSSEPNQLLARLTWCIDSGLADGASKIASFQQALVSSEKFRRFEDFIRLNNGAVHPPKLCVDFTIFGFEVHISALSLAATKFVEILEAVELARVDGRSITIESSLALTPENEALAALLPAEHQFAKLMRIFNAPIPLSQDGLTEWSEEFLPTKRCALIVRGAQAVDQLMKTAQKFVPAIKCPKHDVVPKEDRAVASDIGSINKMVVICSTAMPRLVVTWLLTEPDAIGYRCKPLNYLAYLLHQEHSGGLLQRLRERDLVTDIQVVLPEEGLESNRNWSVFRVIFMITSKGVEMKEQIAGALFAYLSHVWNNDILEWIYREAAMSCQLKHEFGSPQFLPDRKTLCKAVMDYAPGDCIDGSHLMMDFDDQLIRKTITLLSESAFNMILEGDFDVSAFPEAEAHQNIGLVMKMPDFDRESSSWNFTKYSPNEFMPRVLALRREQRFLENYPNVLSKTASHRLWYQFRDSNSPKVYCFVNFVKQPAGSLEWFVSAELACAILERSLLTRRASEAGIDFQCAVTNSGITISIVAVNESLGAFVEHVVRHIQKGEISPNLYQECHTDLVESYRLRTTNAGLAENIFAQMHGGQLDLSKKMEAVTACQKGDVAAVFKDLRECLFRECFIYGNLRADDALQAIRSLDEIGCGQSSQPLRASPVSSLSSEDRSHPGIPSDRSGIALLYYHWEEPSDMNNAFFLEVLSDFLNSRLQISDSTVYCMPRSRNGEATGFTVELACDKSHVSRNCSLLEKTLTQMVAELSDDRSEIEQVFSTAKKHFKRRRDISSGSCSLMAREAHAHMREILNATYRFGTCFDAENAINCLESEVFYNWILESVACGYLKQPLYRVRVG